MLVAKGFSALPPSLAGKGARGSGPRAEEAGEGQLSRLWYGEACLRPGLRTTCGRRVRVLYRGLPNGDRGPDYLGAVLSLGRGRPRRGDIELHVRTSQWRAHGHHRDDRYDAVILHVVWEDDDPRGTILSCGRQVPVLALARLASAADGAPAAGEPCRQTCPWPQERVGAALDRAGEERFLGAAARLEGEMAVYPAQEVLYQALAEALGYSRNKEPFRRLASTLPLAVLEGYLWGKEAGLQEDLAQALLLGAAGLLPSQRGPESREEWPGRLEALWRASGLERCLAPGEWCLAVRPGNHPVRRLAGLASMIVESLGQGLVDWALALLKDPWLRLRREARGYWGSHYDFGRPGGPAPSLVGRQRALEMASNAMLPFAYAYGQGRGRGEISRWALDAYRLLPSPGSNQVTRHMAWQLLGLSRYRLAGTARRQQGLLHLFRSYCTAGRCGLCPLGSRVQGQGSGGGPIHCHTTMVAL